jgi:hypothetical protein
MLMLTSAVTASWLILTLLLLGPFGQVMFGSRLATMLATLMTSCRSRNSFACCLLGLLIA